MARDSNSVPLQPVSQSRGRSETDNGSRNGAKKRGLNPMFLGIIIGMLLGVGIALGFAIWLNRANNPFIEKSRPVEALPTIPARTLQPPSTSQSVAVAPGAKAEANAKGDAEKPRFEFYQILPGEKSEKSGRPEAVTPPKPVDTMPKAGPAEPKVAPDTRTAPKIDAKIDIKPASTEVFFLQAGAFQSPTDADNVKAKVAFAGFEAVVRPVNLPDKGTLYRVRLGPYKSQDEVNRIKTTLSQSGIAAAVVKGTD